MKSMKTGVELKKIITCNDTKFLFWFFVSLLLNFPIEKPIISVGFKKVKKCLFY